MKRFVAALALAVVSTTAFAQQKVNEGTITYAVEWNLPAQAEAMRSFLPNDISVNFRGDSTATVQAGTMSKSVMLYNAKTSYMRLLLDIPMQKKKMAVTFTPADQEMMADKMPEFELVKTTETKKIGAYTATKYAATEKKSGEKFDAWFTTDIQVPSNSLSQFFDAKYGVPLEFKTFQNGVGITAKFKELKPQAIAAGSFGSTKDYEELTAEQFGRMMGGR